MFVRDVAPQIGTQAARRKRRRRTSARVTALAIVAMMPAMGGSGGAFAYDAGAAEEEPVLLELERLELRFEELRRLERRLEQRSEDRARLGEVPQLDRKPEIERELRPKLVPRRRSALYPSLFETHDIVAYYGNPRSDRMGILGEQPLEQTTELLKRRAAEYAELSRETGREVLPGFHLVYATVFPDGELGRLSEALLTKWIEYALERDVLVILDHQIGRHSVERAITEMLPYLRYPNVHLAIDPEWATEVPGQEVGGVHAEEVNAAQRMIQEHLIENDLPGRRVFVVHQFHRRMIEEAHKVRSDFERVDVVHNMDGFGPPRIKLNTWNYLLRFDNLPLKGFKLFYPKSWRAGGYDDPLMTPAEVLQLEPRPVFIQYQ